MRCSLRRARLRISCASVAADTSRALQLPEMKEKLSALGADPVGGSPEEFALRLRAENTRWGDAIRKAGIKLDQ